MYINNINNHTNNNTTTNNNNTHNNNNNNNHNKPRTGELCPISLLRSSLLRFVDSKFPGNSLWT